MTTPDFEALRAKRNAKALELRKQLADELGMAVERTWSSFNPNACYCACGTGGPCEHKWDGPEYESEDGRCFSVTCSRCGCTAMSHDLRNAP